MQELIIRSVNISEKKGTVKQAVDKIIINNKGVLNDAHSGDWHRQVSLLGVESIEKASKLSGQNLAYGLFAENITTEGMEIFKMKISDRLMCGDVVLEISQIGKNCHRGCEIMQKVGNCIMPTEGIFAKVISGGTLKAGDELKYSPSS